MSRARAAREALRALDDLDVALAGVAWGGGVVDARSVLGPELRRIRRYLHARAWDGRR